MNKHAADVLDAYLDAETHPVPHAVLIEGKWGTGKTHFLRKIYEPGRAKRVGRKHVPFLFVSLFGATSAHDVETRIFKEACPGEAVAGGIAGTIALGIGEFFQVAGAAKGTLQAIRRRAIRRLNEFVFVLDDLERVEPAAMGEVMGLVASLVDRHQRRVILVADESELRKRFADYEWDRRAEKVIGRRATIEPAFEDLARNLTSELSEGKTADFMRNRTSEVLDVVAMSGTRNLRDLAWALHNATRFADCLLADPDVPEEHVLRTIQLVVAVSLWSRSGPVDRRALEDLPELSILIQMDSYAKRRSRENSEYDQEHSRRDAQMDVIKDFLECFAALNVESPPVDYAAILDFEQGGVLDGEALLLQVKERFGFGPNHSEPPWRVLWHSRKQTFARTEQALDDLAKELAGRRYESSGEILHVIGQAIKFKNAGDDRLTGGVSVVPFFQSYIDDLENAGRLEPISDDRFAEEETGGLGFFGTEEEEFKKLHRYLRKKRADVASADQRREVDTLLRAFEQGRHDELLRLVRNDDTLSRRQVLSHLDPDQVAGLLAKDPVSLDIAGKLLAYRYSDVTPNGPLEAELPWARSLAAAIMGRVEHWAEPHRSLGLEAFRGIIRHYEQGREPRFQILAEIDGVSVESDRGV